MDLTMASMNDDTETSIRNQAGSMTQNIKILPR